MSQPEHQESLPEKVQGRFRRAHRVVWAMVNGPIPDGMAVCHRCDNPSCVRPDHLSGDTWGHVSTSPAEGTSG